MLLLPAVAVPGGAAAAAAAAVAAVAAAVGCPACFQGIKQELNRF